MTKREKYLKGKTCEKCTYRPRTMRVCQYLKDTFEFNVEGKVFRPACMDYKEE